MTDRVGRQVYTLVSVLESTGQLTEAKKAEIQDQIAQDLLTGEGYESYESIDLSLVTNPSPTTMALYFEETASIIGELEFGDPNPVVLLQNAIEQNKPRIIEEGIIPQIESLEETRQRLVRVEVHPNFVNDHLQLVNTLWRVEQDQKALQSFYLDPLAGYAATIKYSANGLTLTEQIESTLGLFARELEAFIN